MRIEDTIPAPGRSTEYGVLRINMSNDVQYR